MDLGTPNPAHLRHVRASAAHAASDFRLAEAALRSKEPAELYRFSGVAFTVASVKPILLWLHDGRRTGWSGMTADCRDRADRSCSSA